MKNSCGLLLVTLSLLMPLSVWAEAGNHYTIVADAGAADAYAAAPESLLLTELESRFDVYNLFFRFDPSLVRSPFIVRVFGDKDAYDLYVTEHLGFARPGAVYLHYNQTERRELVIHRGSREEASMLAHQAFVQYLRAFIPNPPSWILEGFAIYFSSLEFVPPGTLSYEENLLWLESVKKLGTRLPGPETILQTDISGYYSVIPPSYNPESRTGTGPGIVEDFQISSWALVSFLLNASLDYYRTLTESFMLLSPYNGTAENARAVMNRFFLWNDLDVMRNDFMGYLDSRKTYRELIDEGNAAYSRGDIMNAEFAFMTAKEEYPSEFTPYYYLGLLSYEGKDYESAEYYYLASLERGADEALVNYALGINAASAGRRNDAEDYLHRAAALDPGKYRSRVEELLKKIWE